MRMTKVRDRRRQGGSWRRNTHQKLSQSQILRPANETSSKHPQQQQQQRQLVVKYKRQHLLMTNIAAEVMELWLVRGVGAVRFVARPAVTMMRSEAVNLSVLPKPTGSNFIIMQQAFSRSKNASSKKIGVKLDEYVIP